MLVGPRIHQVKVCLCRTKVLLPTCEQVSPCAGNAHPGNIIVVVVLPPVGTIAVTEVAEQLVKHGGIAGVSCRFKGIHHNLHHFCIFPPSAFSDDVTHLGRVVILTLPAVHHFIAYGRREACGDGSILRHAPLDAACRHLIVFTSKCQLYAIAVAGCGCQEHVWMLFWS